MFNLSFDMAEIADGEGKAFAFILPARPDWPERLTRITLSGPEGVAIMDGGDDQEKRDVPTAALLLDAVTGKVRGILQDWPSAGPLGVSAKRVLPEPGLRVVISTGLPEPADWQR